MHRVVGDTWPHGHPCTGCLGTCGPMTVTHRVPGDMQGAWGHMALWTGMHRVLGDMWPYGRDAEGAGDTWPCGQPCRGCLGTSSPMTVTHRVLRDTQPTGNHTHSAWGQVAP